MFYTLLTCFLCFSLTFFPTFFLFTFLSRAVDTLLWYRNAGWDCVSSSLSLASVRCFPLPSPVLTLALTLVLSSLSQVPPPCTHPRTRTPAHYPYTAAPCRGARAPVRLPLSLSHSPTFFGIVVTWGPLHCPLVVVSVHRRKHKVIRYNKVPGRRASCRRRRRRHS